jgi:hypothetical protein
LRRFAEAEALREAEAKIAPAFFMFMPLRAAIFRWLFLNPRTLRRAAIYFRLLLPDERFRTTLPPYLRSHRLAMAG